MPNAPLCRFGRRAQSERLEHHDKQRPRRERPELHGGRSHVEASGQFGLAVESARHAACRDKALVAIVVSC